MVYVLPSEDARLQIECLEELAEEIRAAGFPSASFGTLGLEVDDDGLWADLKLCGQPEKPHLQVILGRVAVVPAVGGDFRPLYLIPYDPAAADNQDPEERRYCYRQLLERVYLSVVRAIGTAPIPDTVVLLGDELIRQATFGISEKWHAKELGALRTRLLKSVASVMGKKELKGKVDFSNTRVEVRISSEGERQAAINLLLKANSAQLALDSLNGQIDIEDDTDR
ncbi:hypothetical protein OG264_19030 [Streptomyces xanthophaeus]|uniref:hypothetical protein n=1 Tax=Streptomyces xanthophaeus TaxID=67385 RepID=UPI00386EC560|nr:hypothetical protein OG264_19030 [Streptomyces xanthophaeus]WST61613.1 hypothetical protein OG605_19405 [Streptomyces xanthophaeus]